MPRSFRLALFAALALGLGGCAFEDEKIRDDPDPDAQVEQSGYWLTASPDRQAVIVGEESDDDRAGDDAHVAMMGGTAPLNSSSAGSRSSRRAT